MNKTTIPMLEAKTAILVSGGSGISMTDTAKPRIMLNTMGVGDGGGPVNALEKSATKRHAERERMTPFARQDGDASDGEGHGSWAFWAPAPQQTTSAAPRVLGDLLKEGGGVDG